MEFNKLVFPAPQSSYTEDLSEELEEGETLIFVPRIKHQSPRKKENYNTTSFSFSQKKEKEENKHEFEKKQKPEGYIPCLYLPFNDERGKFSNMLMIYFHGNAEDIFLAYDLLRNLKKELKYFEPQKVNVLAMEYPGYGLYPGDTKAEKICEDSEILYDFLKSELGFPEEKIIIFGRSIGTGPATYIASKRSPGALILMSAYLSIKAVVTHLVGKFLAWTVADRFRNIENIKKVKCPVFFLHGKMDDLIPCEHSKELYSNSNVGEFWFPNKMTHNSFNILSDLLIPIDTFLDKYKIKVMMMEKNCLEFPKEIFLSPYSQNNGKHANSQSASSIYNYFFGKK